MDACDGSASHGAWLTPAGMAGLDHTGKAGAGGEFAAQATSWATPRATDGEKGGPNCRGGRGDPILAGQAVQWPTPNAAVFEPKATPPVMAHRKATDPQIGLADVAVHCFESTALGWAWPTPASRDYKGQDLASREGGASLSHAAETGVFSHSSPQVQQIPGGPDSLPATPTLPRRLNPLFVEWLMGWPLQWTNAVPHASSAAATASWRSALQQRLSCLLAEQASPVERLAA
jgi:hypothetical protein